MYLVERHIVKSNEDLDKLCFNSKNLYNKALYIIRQHYFNTKEYLDYVKINRLLVDSKDVDYYALPIKVSVQTLRLLDRNFKSFFSLIKKRKSKDYNKPVRVPRYLDKDGRTIAVFPKDAISRIFIRKGLIKLSTLNILIPTKVTESNLVEVRVLPRNNHHIVEVVYEKEEKPLLENNGRYAAIDLGLNNLATVCSNVEKPFIINGRPLKSINQRWNKHKANLQSRLANKSSKQLALITEKKEQ